MVNLITFLVITAIVGGAGFYIYKEKKRGVKCIGCPWAETCGKQTACSGSCASCSHHQ